MVNKAKKRKYVRRSLTNLKGQPITLEQMDKTMNYPKSVDYLPSLMTELQATISELESQLTAQIDRIKSILS